MMEFPNKERNKKEKDTNEGSLGHGQWNTKGQGGGDENRVARLIGWRELSGATDSHHMSYQLVVFQYI